MRQKKITNINLNNKDGMSRRRFLQTSSFSAAAIAANTILGSSVNQIFAEEKSDNESEPLSRNRRKPNFVIIFLDDSGWADFKPFGNPEYPTPHVHKLAEEGCRFNRFYVPQAVCSASRGALLSGCYPGRTKLNGAHGPNAWGLDPKYATLGEVLQKAGYYTAVFGKWHIGDQPQTRPPARGFNESCGLMYSHDMWPYNHKQNEKSKFPPLPFWENGKIINPNLTPEDLTKLTTIYTEHAVDFIKRNKEKQFFLYVPHSLPHVPLFVSEKYRNKSGVGLYGDVIMEIDWSVGQIMKALKDNGLEEDTYVLFSADHGPWRLFGTNSGKTPFRESKQTSFDGGIRSAMIMKYPGKIRPGSVSERTLGSIDILPTIAHLAGAKLPENEIDGKNVWDLIVGKRDAKNPHEFYAISQMKDFESVLSGDGKWKLHLPHKYRHIEQFGEFGFPGKYEKVKGVKGYPGPPDQVQQDLALYDMESDPYERVNVIKTYPEIAKKLIQLAEKYKKEFYS